MGSLNYSKATELQTAVSNYHLIPSEPNGKNLGKMFYEIAEEVMRTFEAIVPKVESKTGLTRQLAIHAFTRVENFDADKGKAINYFLSVMLSLLRSIYQNYRKQVELEERFNRYLP